MPLTDLQIKRAQAQDKPYKLADEKGLYLLIKQAGKYWRFDYSFGGKRKTEAFGVYPDITLAVAREKRDEARRLIASEIDPSMQRKAKKEAFADRSANSFEVVAREWFNMMQPTWATSHSKRIIARLQKDIFPWLGGRPIAEITPPELLACLKRIEARTIETAHRAHSECDQIFQYAIATGRTTQNEAYGLKKGLKPFVRKHFAAVIDPKAVGPLLRKLHSYNGTAPIRCGLKLAPLLLVRPGELRHAEWEHMNLETAEWRFFCTKRKIDHIVPLPVQAVEMLRELQITNGHRKYVFGGNRATRPASENTFLQAMRSMDIGPDEMTVHGFRAMARTIMDEELEIRVDYIEHQMTHAVRDANGRAYNRTSHLEGRRRMMQQWADYLDALRLSETS